MSEPQKDLLRITVHAPRRGKLGLDWAWSDGTSDSEPASVARIYKVLANHGHSISAEALSRIAFCGHRLVLTQRLQQGPVDYARSATKLS